jgi:hypothetical protein
MRRNRSGGRVDPSACAERNNSGLMPTMNSRAALIPDQKRIEYQLSAP